MKIITLILALTLFSCTQNYNKVTNSNKKQAIAQLSSEKVALDFVNNYVEFCNDSNKKVSFNEWITTQANVSEKYVDKILKIIDVAEKNSQDMLLDSDPIFDAQDYPEKGFEAEKYAHNSNVIFLNGIHWKEYKLKVSLIQENGTWFVADIKRLEDSK